MMAQHGRAAVAAEAATHACGGGHARSATGGGGGGGRARGGDMDLPGKICGILFAAFSR